MKKVSKNLFILGAICLGLTACNSGGSDDKTCKVDFSSLGEIVKSINVQYGKRITEKIEDPVGPTVSYKFKGWYEDEKAESKKWSFETDIVKNDLTLYAGWTILSSSPSNIASGKEAFSSDITWMQQGFDSSSSLYVKIYKVLSEKTDEEGNVTKTYGEEQLIEGKTSYDDENSVVTFVPDVIPQGGEYKVAIKYGTLEEVVAENFFFKGEGSEQNPYLITDENDFKAITSAESATSVGLNKYYSLYKDIAVEGDYQSEKDVTFEGTFFGNNKKITVSGNCGAFGVIGQNGSVSDVTIAGEISTASWPYIGALANTNRGKVTKVISNASVTSSAGEVKSLETEQDGRAGGIVGINEETGVIENVLFSNSSGDSSTGVVKANIGGGGIVGTNRGKIKKATNKGCIGAYNSVETGKSLSKYSYSGGIAGFNYGEIEESMTTGTGKILAQRSTSSDTAVEKNNYALGGIVGYNKKGGKIKTSIFSGIRVHGDEAVGGIAGLNGGEISSSYSYGRYVSSISIRGYIGGRVNVGGIAGEVEESSVIDKCYNTANVFSYETEPYGIAAKADNSVNYSTNLDENTIYSKDTASLSPKTNSLLAPSGTGNAVKETKALEKGDESNAIMDASYISILGSEYLESENDTLRLKWEVNDDEKEKLVINYYDGGALLKSVTFFDEIGSSLNLYRYTKENYKLQGWKLSADAEEIYDLSNPLTFAELKAVSQDGVVNLYADWKEEEKKSSLVIAYLTANFTEDIISGAQKAFEEYCVANSIAIENLVFRGYEQKKVNDYTAAILNDGDVDILLGCGKNIDTAGNVIENVIAKENYLFNNDDSRYYATLNLGGNVANLEHFISFLNTDVAKKAFNPAVSTDTLRIAVYSRYVDSTILANLETAFREYLTQNNITISNLAFVSLGESKTKVSDFVDLVLQDEVGFDCVLGGGSNIGTTAGTNSGTTLSVTNKAVNIAGSGRQISTITTSANLINVNTFVEFCLSEAGTAILNPAA